MEGAERGHACDPSAPFVQGKPGADLLLRQEWQGYAGAPVALIRHARRWLGSILGLFRKRHTMNSAFKVICDQVGVTHRFEAASKHNTRCGLLVYREHDWGPILGGEQGKLLREGAVDCMTCLVGRSNLNLWDLHEGVEVQAWVRLYDTNGPIGSAQPITFSHGVNVCEVIFHDLPEPWCWATHI